MDTLDSFTCDCRDGYELDEDGLTCNSILILLYIYI